jgi:mannose/fructose/sorbose-specific phosphotransferase system IIA component
MIGVVVATHGEFGNVLTATLGLLLGEPEGVRSVALGADETLETFQKKVEEALTAVDPQKKGALMMVDMMGGTPFNVGLRLAQTRPLQVVTGVNLAMLIQVGSNRGEAELETYTREVQKAGRDGIVTSLELLKK